MFNELHGSGGTNDPKPFSDAELRWATANPQELQLAFEEFAKKYRPLFKERRSVYPEYALIVSEYFENVTRQYYVKGQEPGNFDGGTHADFTKREIWGGGFVYVPDFVRKDIEGTIDAIHLDRVGTSPLHDGLGRYVRREGRDFDLYIDERGGHVDEIFGCHRKDGRLDGSSFNFARSETRSPIEEELDFGTRKITTGQNSVEATYSEKEDGESVVILKVVQKGEPLGTITIPVLVDHEKVKEKLFPELDFSDPFNAHPKDDSSWLEADLLETVGIVWNLSSR